MSKVSKEHAHIIAHDFLDIQLIFDPKKSFGKLRLEAFRPFRQMLSVSKHVGGVEGYFDL